MATPIEFKCEYTWPGGYTYQDCTWDITLPDTNYTVSPDFQWTCGGWFITNKTTTGCRVNVGGGVGNAIWWLYVYWDSTTFEDT